MWKLSSKIGSAEQEVQGLSTEKYASSQFLGPPPHQQVQAVIKGVQYSSIKILFCKILSLLFICANQFQWKNWRQSTKSQMERSEAIDNFEKSITTMSKNLF